MVKIEMYYSDWCGFCHRARNLLESKGVAWTGYDVNSEAGRRQEMMARGGGNTVPQIFLDDAPVGGSDEIAALDREGRLDGMLGIESTESESNVPG
ncbi:MAG: glutaredoxin 3 [Rhodospirillales bacterium]|jgi:glutaredoxin 3|nr:glutaredoxin 3 [Rhodospirillales bacterium]MBT4006572.1 glutaredoxin 3 [Rhodospirillales bacterium]MBT5077095.1 glutaredoxin 3 [Rhodospirillales bacterium]MBT5113850.1 glutaredoxin 3 [Rhodospirillales bacterium]MBT5672378.1 glutaredoxin 3 [Rhodospirillales bacterium]